MSLLGRRDGLPARTVLIPVDPRPSRRGTRSTRRLLVVLAGTVALAGGAGAVALLRHGGSHPPATPGPPPPPARPAPRVTARARPPSAAALLARARDRSTTRLEGLGVPVFCGAAVGRDVALTFDDGPGPYTARVLAVLRRFHARATFFLVGNRLRYWPHLPAAEATLGTVGDHTWNHADLTRLPRAAAAADVTRARSAIASTARATVRLFRTPYGRDPAWLGRFLASRRMLEIRWSVDPGDYLPGATPATIVRHVARGLRPGAIVLLHDIHAATLRALPQVLALLRRRHLRAVTVPELLRADAPSYRQLEADNRGRGCVDLATAGRE
jgi:peptidoglycan-N-acetylglucosamine deacetylase